MKEKEIYSEDYSLYLANRSLFRKIVRGFYLRDIKRNLIGKTIDFGCGSGELLKMLPAGSLGFEVNPHSVAYCRGQGLNVEEFFVEDDYAFKKLKAGEYESFTMNHVLEHLEKPELIMEKIFESCNRLGIKRLVFTVPGFKSFPLDKTHVTFVDLDYLEQHGILNNKFYKLVRSGYFPFNIKKLSYKLPHVELRMVFDRR